MSSLNSSPVHKSQQEEVGGKRDRFLTENGDKILELSLQELVDLDNITRRENGAPLIETPTITLQEGEYASNGNVKIICTKRNSGGTPNYAVAMRLDDATLQQNGFKQVSHYVPFSNGVNRVRVPLVARFMDKETELLAAEQKKDDEKYAVN